MRVDTVKPRSFLLALVVKFPDGTIDRSTGQTMRVVTRAQHEEQLGAFSKTLDRIQAVEVRMRAAFPDPCAAPDTTVKWLLAQPEVEHAANHRGHNLSYIVDGISMMVMCHQR